MSHEWTRLRERSSDFWLRVIVWIALHIGRPFARVLLYPIAAYFLVFSDRTPSIDILTRVRGHSPSWIELFRHYLVFSETILDRVFVFVGRDEFFKIDVHGLDLLDRYLSERRGFLLVGAHMGSFEILRALGKSRRSMSVKAMTYGGNSPKINAIFRSLNPELFADVINMGEPSALFGLDDHVAAGGVAAMLGDRSVHGEKRVLCNFLGEGAWFPAAPVLLANLLKAPVLLFFCLHRGDARYEVHFELLAERIAVSRLHRNEELQQWMQRYADRLEYFCRREPENWFNFYNFWDKSGD
jgi:predicted LPLAT superfamily acyltransferase